MNTVFPSHWTVPPGSKRSGTTHRWTFGRCGVTSVAQRVRRVCDPRMPAGRGFEQIIAAFGSPDHCRLTEWVTAPPQPHAKAAPLYEHGPVAFSARASWHSASWRVHGQKCRQKLLNQELSLAPRNRPTRSRHSHPHTTPKVARVASVSSTNLVRNRTLAVDLHCSCSSLSKA
jgi:hypothetical protein